MTWPRWWAWTAATPVASTAVTATAEADLNEQLPPRCRGGRGGAPARPCGAPSSSTAPQEAGVGAEGEQLGRPGQRVDDLGGQGAGERGHLLVAAAAPGEQGGHGQRDQERDAEGERRPTAG